MFLADLSLAVQHVAGDARGAKDGNQAALPQSPILHQVLQCLKRLRMPDIVPALVFLDQQRDELGKSYLLRRGTGKRVDPLHLGDEPLDHSHFFHLRQVRSRKRPPDVFERVPSGSFRRVERYLRRLMKRRSTIPAPPSRLRR